MRLYLNDDVADKSLRKELEKAGHDVHAPEGTGRPVSVHDADHMAKAIEDNRVMLTKNDKDFDPIAKLLRVAGGRHPGILVIREDQNRKDMTHVQVLQAIEKASNTLGGVADRVVILNDWR